MNRTTSTDRTASMNRTTSMASPVSRPLASRRTWNSRASRARVSFLCGAALVLGVASWHTVRANNLTFVVTSTADSPDNTPGDGVCQTSSANGAFCTLRAAIQEANAQDGPDIIEFNIAGAGVQTIAPASPLPNISSPLEIRGYTQPGSSANTLAAGSNAVLRIELNGQNAGASTNGLNVSVAGCNLSGLVINRFLNGINLSGSTVSNNSVTGCFLGTDATGLIARPNRSVGIFFNAAGTGTTIGGTGVGARNLISGNTDAGIFLTNQSNSNIIQGNLIGTNATGNLSLGNGSNGIFIDISRGNLVGGTVAGARNIISGNGFGSADGEFPGIAISDSGNTVQNNYIGTNAMGMAKVPNAAEGIDLIGARGTLIENNLISGNNNIGIGLFDESIDNIIRGNQIGLDAAGVPTLGNGKNGIVVASVRDGGTIQNTGNRITQNSIAGNGALGIDLGAIPDADTLTGDGVTPNDAGDADSGPNNLQNFPVLTRASGNSIQGTLNSLPNTQFFIECFVNPSNPSNSYQGQTPVATTFSGVVNTNSSGIGSFLVTSNAPLTAGTFITATATRATATSGPGDTSEFSAAIRVSAQTVNTTTTLASSINPSEFGQSVTFTATVANFSTPAQTGTVTFRDGGTTLGTAAINAQGVATFLTSTLAQGTHPITASYGGGGSLDGNTNFNASTSAALNQVVNPVSACSTVVSNTLDSGAGSLRSAIDCSNSVPFLQTISFSIPGAGVQTIAPTSALPTVSNPVIIDGLTQSGATPNTLFGTVNAQLRIELSGANAGTSADGLTLSAADSTVRGLAINRFRNGIALSGAGASGNAIEGCFIGTNVQGTAALPNLANGVSVGGAGGNRVGGDTNATVNLISDNGQDGVNLSSPGNMVLRNTIVAQTRDGVRVESAGAIGNDISLNNISDNGGLGINLVAATDPTNGVTPNDASDPDSGPNGLQNAPVLISAAADEISLTLNSVPNSEFFFEFFYNAPNAANSYEGQRFFLSARQNGLLTDAQGNLTFSISRPLEAGQFLTATATRLNGNTRLETSEFSSPILVGATKDNTTTTLTSSLNPAEVGQNVTFSATVTRAAGTATPTGSVTFRDGNATLGTGPLNAQGVATLTTSFTSTGQRNITATYDGDANFLGSTSAPLLQTVNAATSCSTVVTTTSDSGAGSLRAAIDCSNITAGKQTISFNITQNPPVIALASALPDVSDPAIIDGYTQPGSSANTLATGALNASPRVAIRGGGNSWALRVTGGSSIVRGLIINAGQTRNGIRLFTGGGNTIEGCFIGTDADGTAFSDTTANNIGIAIVSSPNNIVGGAAPAARNLISGNFADGVQIAGTASTGNRVQGNLIGTSKTGALALRNTGNGVALAVSSAGTTVESNLISGNGFTPTSPPQPNFHGVEISSSSTGNTLRGNQIGTNSAGTGALPNSRAGVKIETDGNTLVGNLISGNREEGVSIENASNNALSANFIGTDGAGAAALPNGGNGVLLTFSSNNNTIGGATVADRNLISGNALTGIKFDGPIGGAARVAASSKTRQAISVNTVAGNYIGTDISGATAIPNAEGIEIYNAQQNTIGGVTTTPGTAPGNLVAGNRGVGIEISSGGGSNGEPSTLNRVIGNVVGLNAQGNALPNDSGVLIEESAQNTIGAPDGANVIAGNRNEGILVTGIGSLDNVFSANFVGVQPDRTTARGNGGHGIALIGSSPNTIGGGLIPGNANTIAFNGGDGVSIVFANGVCIQKGISENSIFSNAGLGIDLENDGVTPNDGDNSSTTAIDPDSDMGANQLQNFPVLNSTRGTTLSGTLLSAPNTSFRVEFFASDAADPSGFGEGQRFLGSTNSTTDASGNASISFAPATPVPGGQFISATATDPQDNTSEFSRAVQVENGVTSTLSIADLRVTEGDSGTLSATFTVSLSTPSIQPVTVNFATANGTAAQPGDYLRTSGALTFSPGQTRKTLKIQIVGDTLDEPDETFRVNLSAPSGSVIADGQGIGTIADNDPTPTASINSVRVTEGNAGSKNANFTVSLSNPSTSAQVIDFSTADGTATAGSDYTATTGTLIIAAGKTKGTIAVPVLGDTAVEPNETFVVNIFSGTADRRAQAKKDVKAKKPGAIIGAGQGTGTITNDDVAVTPPTFSIGDASVVEGNSSTKNLTFTVSRSVTTGNAATVAFATANGSAQSGLDYTATSGTLSFAAGQTSRTLSIPIAGETLREPNETLTVTLSAPSPANARLARAQGTGTIVNDDSLSDLQITQSVAPGPIPVGSETIFTLQVRNDGPDAAQNVVVSNQLPAGATFVSASGATFTQSGSTLSFALGTLENRASRALQITLRAPSVAGPFNNSASVSGTGTPDSNSGNNASTATAQAVLGPQNINGSLQITTEKLVRIGAYVPGLYRPGARFAQRVTIRNTSGNDITGPVSLVLDGLPAGVELVNRSGVTAMPLAGQTFVALNVGGDGVLSAGETSSVQLEFRLRASQRPAFTPRVLAGPGAP